MCTCSHPYILTPLNCSLILWLKTVQFFIQHVLWSWNVLSSIATLCFAFPSEIDQIDRYEMHEYIKTSVRNSSYQSKTSVHALSAVLESPIRLFWPQVEFLDMPKNSYVAIGRGVENRLNPSVTLMFTSTSFDGHNFNFNHWVPLVQMQEVCSMTMHHLIIF